MIKKKFGTILSLKYYVVKFELYERSFFKKLLILPGKWVLLVKKKHPTFI